MSDAEPVDARTSASSLDHDQLLTVPEAGQLLSRGETFTRRLIKEGRLRAVLVDGVLRVPRSAVSTFIAALPEAATPEPIGEEEA